MPTPPTIRIATTRGSHMLQRVLARCLAALMVVQTIPPVVWAKESPLVDTQQTSTSTSLDSDQLAKIPTSRDPWAILQATPGVVDNKAQPGDSVNSNNFLVDGTRVGNQNVPVIDPNLLEEVRTMRDWPAEYGGVNGTVIALGKSGPKSENTAVFYGPQGFPYTSFTQSQLKSTPQLGRDALNYGCIISSGKTGPVTSGKSIMGTPMTREEEMVLSAKIAAEREYDSRLTPEAARDGLGAELKDYKLPLSLSLSSQLNYNFDYGSGGKTDGFQPPLLPMRPLKVGGGMTQLDPTTIPLLLNPEGGSSSVTMPVEQVADTAGGQPQQQGAGGKKKDPRPGTPRTVGSVSGRGRSVDDLTWGAFVQESSSLLPALGSNAGIRSEQQQVRPVRARGAGQASTVPSWSEYYNLSDHLPVKADFQGAAGAPQAAPQQTSMSAPMPAYGDTLLGSGSPNTTIPAGVTLVVPGIQPQYLDEFVAGAEHEVLEDLRVGLSGQYRRIGEVIEDAGVDSPAVRNASPATTVQLARTAQSLEAIVQEIAAPNGTMQMAGPPAPNAPVGAPTPSFRMTSASTTDADGNTIKLERQPDGSVTRTVTAPGGRVISTAKVEPPPPTKPNQQPQGPRTSASTVDEHGNTIKIEKDANGTTTRTVTAPNGQVLSTVKVEPPPPTRPKQQPQGPRTSASTVDEHGNTITIEKQPDGTTTRTVTGPDGRQISKEKVEPIPPTTAAPRRPGATSASTTDEHGNTVTVERQPDGTRTVQVTDPKGNVLHHGPVASPPPTRVPPRTGGDSASVRNPDGTTTTISRNPDGTRTRTVTGPDGREISRQPLEPEPPTRVPPRKPGTTSASTVDDNGNTISVEQKPGGPRTVRVTDPSGKVLKEGPVETPPPSKPKPRKPGTTSASTVDDNGNTLKLEKTGDGPMIRTVTTPDGREISRTTVEPPAPTKAKPRKPGTSSASGKDELGNTISVEKKADGSTLRTVTDPQGQVISRTVTGPTGLSPAHVESKIASDVLRTTETLPLTLTPQESAVLAKGGTASVHGAQAKEAQPQAKTPERQPVQDAKERKTQTKDGQKSGVVTDQDAADALGRLAGQAVFGGNEEAANILSGLGQFLSPEGRQAVVNSALGHDTPAPAESILDEIGEDWTAPATDYVPKGEPTVEDLPNGGWVRRWPDGTVETHYPDGRVEAHFPNGDDYVRLPDGTTYDVDGDGFWLIRDPDGYWIDDGNPDWWPEDLEWVMAPTWVKALFWQFYMMRYVLQAAGMGHYLNRWGEPLYDRKPVLLIPRWAPLEEQRSAGSLPGASPSMPYGYPDAYGLKPDFKLTPQIGLQYNYDTEPKAQPPAQPSEPYYTPNLDGFRLPQNWSPESMRLLQGGCSHSDKAAWNDNLNRLWDGQWSGPKQYLFEPIYYRQIQDEPNDPLYDVGEAARKKAELRARPKPRSRGPDMSMAAPAEGGMSMVAMEGPSHGKEKGPKAQDQWGLRSVGFTPVSDAQSAWRAASGAAANAIVAVIDSGLDFSHPDGPAHVWTNPKETPDNAIDDDRNGYVDDVHGWNFLEENHDLRDFKGHGTLVAGIIAAKRNNGIGIAGINPGARIMVLKVTDAEGRSNSLNIYRAIHYAVDQGARVINISLGEKGVSQLEQLAVNYAHARGAVVIVAAGNQGAPLNEYGPGALRRAFTVAAQNMDGARSGLSNHGPNVAVMAPGEEIYSLHSKDADWPGHPLEKERLYRPATGTSFAAPIVAATASLVVAKHPAWPNWLVEDALLNSTRPSSDGWEPGAGWGAINAAQAVSFDPKQALTVQPTELVVKREQKKVASVAVFGIVRGVFTTYQVELGKGHNPKEWQPLGAPSDRPVDHGLLCRIDGETLGKGKEWTVRITANGPQGRSKSAYVPLTI